MLSTTQSSLLLALLLLFGLVALSHVDDAQLRPRSAAPGHSSGGSTRELLDFQESAASDARHFLRAYPRRTWTMSNVSEFCAWDDDTSSCDWIAYAQALSIVALPSLVIGLVSTIVLGVLFCVRCCCCVRKRCCLFPWRRRSGERFVLSLVLLLLALCFVGLIGVSLLGNVWSHQGVGNTSEGASDFADTVFDLTTDAGTLLLSIDATYTTQVTEALGLASDVDDALSNVLDILDKAEIGRLIFFIVIYAALFLVALCTIVFIFFFRSFLFSINFWYSWLVFIFIFLSLTFCIVTGAVVSDVCAVYDQTLHGNTNSTIFTKFLGSAWGDCSAMDEILNPLFDQYNETVTEGCNYYDDLCSRPETGVTNCTACNSTSDKSLILNTNVREVLYCGTDMEAYCPSNSVCQTCSSCACYNATQTIAQCSTSCRSPDNRNTSLEVITYANLMASLDDMITRVKPYAGCNLITRMVEATNEPLCVQYLSGDFLLILGTIGICGVWLLYQVALTLAYERSYRHFDEEGKDDEQEASWF